MRKNGVTKSATLATQNEANVWAKQKQNIVNQKKGHPKGDPTHRSSSVLKGRITNSLLTLTTSALIL